MKSIICSLFIWIICKMQINQDRVFRDFYILDTLSGVTGN